LLRQTAHDQEVVGFNPSTLYWRDVSDASFYINSYTKITQIKVAKCGTPKEIFFVHLFSPNGWLKKGLAFKVTTTADSQIGLITRPERQHQLYSFRLG
jgi:hypothetical protein